MWWPSKATPKNTGSTSAAGNKGRAKPANPVSGTDSESGRIFLLRKKTGLSAPIPQLPAGTCRELPVFPLLSLALLKIRIHADFQLGVCASRKLQKMETAGIHAGASLPP
jgi:hypothetical protein